MYVNSCGKQSRNRIISRGKEPKNNYRSFEQPAAHAGQAQAGENVIDVRREVEQSPRDQHRQIQKLFKQKTKRVYFVSRRSIRMTSLAHLHNAPLAERLGQQTRHEAPERNAQQVHRR